MSSSEPPCKLDPNVKTRAMTKEEIRHKVSDMARAAEMAYRAGFQAVEIHGHSGYLLEQFFSPATNFRTDEYGGSLENRFRICDELINGIREKVGNKVVVTLRLSISHMAEGMMTFEDGLAIAKLAEKAGFDAINVDAGSYKAREWIVPPEHIDYHIIEEMSKKAKAELSIPTIHAGGYQMPWQCEEALENDVLDFAGVARAMIADPDWCRKSKLGKEKEIRACIRCNNCLHRVYADKLEQCAVNPTACRELKYRAAFVQTEEPKRLTVIGGGPAGMVAAIVAKRRGNEVTILERDEQLGGQLIIASKESFKTGVKYYMDYLINQVEMRGINVELGCDVTVEKVSETNPDVVVVATGAETYVPDFIQGKEKAGVIDVKELYNRQLNGNEEIIVTGGGQTGAETALALGREGHEVHLLTRSDPDKFLRMAFDFRDLNCIYLGMMKELDEAGVITDGSGCLQTFKYQHFMENPQNTIFPEDVLTMNGPIEASIQGTIGMMDVENVDPSCPVWPLNFPDVPGMFETDEQKTHLAGCPELKTGAPYVHAHCTCTNSTRTVCGHLMPGTLVQSLYQEDEVPSHFTLILPKFKDMKLVFKYNELGGYHELVKE